MVEHETSKFHISPQISFRLLQGFFPLEKLSIGDWDIETDMLLHPASITTLNDLTIGRGFLAASGLKVLDSGANNFFVNLHRLAVHILDIRCRGPSSLSCSVPNWKIRQKIKDIHLKCSW